MTQQHFIKYYIQELHEFNVLYSLLEEAYFDGYDNHLVMEDIYFE